MRRGLVAYLVAAALGLGGCSPGAPPSAPSGTQPASVVATGSDDASAGGSLDTSLFEGHPPGPPPMQTKTTQTTDGVRVAELTYGDASDDQTQALLVSPAAAGSGGPAVLWLHWYSVGSPNADRTEFLDDARALAANGITSLLVEQSFPWDEAPRSAEHDAAAVTAQVRSIRRGIDLLAAQPTVDPERVAVVGHDFGGMYAAVLFGGDPQLKAAVLMSSTGRWADWFARYWPIADAPAVYAAALAPLDPVAWLTRSDGRPVLIQVATDDRYVDPATTDAIAAAVGESAEVRTYDADHELNAAATADRLAWLREALL